MEKLHIKNMVCPRCILAVQQILDKHNYDYKSVQLGEVELHESLDSEQKRVFEEEIKAIGFELIDDRKSRIITIREPSIDLFIAGSLNSF